jgi:hypothetical protein
MARGLFWHTFCFSKVRGFVAFFADAGRRRFLDEEIIMKSTKLHLVILVTIGILAGTLSVAAQAPSSWAVGTFMGRNPNTGNRIRLVIENNGNVTARVERNTNYGKLKKDRLTINGETARLYRTDEGFRTVNSSNGETIDYVRGNGGWNTGSNDWDDNYNQGGRVPSWAVGTFYADNPRGRGSISLTIDSSGRASINVNGGYTSGTVNQETLTVNGERSTLKKISGGVSTRNNRTGETINYNRSGNNNNDGGWNGGNNNNQQGRVPDWAVGTFYAPNPQNGQNMQMTINTDGRVTVDLGGGYYAYGTVYKETLTINGETATLSRTRSGISTTKNSNGEKINYTRR